MSDRSKKRILRATIIYWMLLIYIVAALVWWFIILQQQNTGITDLKYKLLSSRTGSLSEKDLADELYAIDRNTKRNTAKYIGEGVTFLILTLIGAAFVYRSVRRQLRFQQQQQNFLMAITHELKTPISVARLNLETLQKYKLEPEKQEKLLKMTLAEMERLNNLTNNILISSQLEGGGYKITKEELGLSDLFKDRMHNFTQRFPERKFIDAIEPDIDVKGDPLLLQLLVNNLLDNAIKYSPKEKPITVVLKRKGNKIELDVIDEGPGIPAEEKQRIFGKFYRIGSETTRKTQGTGLGLYLCKIIAKDHNADITVTNNGAQGSIFAVIFPMPDT